ncbi:hypothetical protein DZF97_11275 [Clavibacter nebraskensis]|uniref:Uncharacterized protein n=1 Tax=Clavibacter nebraskensis TaxID=31963 RepID=A0A399PNY5_9MICO|nr:hypothetical protein DZF97_11275 [Clavibacter nebraskensis]
MVNVARSNWCQEIADPPAGVRDPRGIATSRAAGMASMRSWWARAEVRQMVASGRRTAASTWSQSAASMPAGR